MPTINQLVRKGRKQRVRQHRERCRTYDAAVGNFNDRVNTQDLIDVASDLLATLHVFTVRLRDVNVRNKTVLLGMKVFVGIISEYVDTLVYSQAKQQKRIQAVLRQQERVFAENADNQSARPEGPQKEDSEG